MTFLTQYYRVLAAQKMRRACIVALEIIGSWGLSQFLIATFDCYPIAGFGIIVSRQRAFPYFLGGIRMR
jgi:hypothetical protein